MPAKRKTPKWLVFAIVQHRQQIDEISRYIDAKKDLPVENQQEWLQKKSVEQFIGEAEGINRFMANLLMRHNCYIGFCYVAPPQRGEIGQQRAWIGADHPEYAEWRLQYLVNE